MYYTYNRISREVYDYCITNKIVDAALIAKWKKTGYERLCSTYTINSKNYKFGTVSICRVPKQSLAPGTQIEDPVTGCRGCASGPGGEKNIFGNRYGQYLAAIQVAREARDLKKSFGSAKTKAKRGEDSDGDGNSSDGTGDGSGSDSEADSDEEGPSPRKSTQPTYTGPVGAADGSSGESSTAIWATAEDDDVELTESMIGQLSEEAIPKSRKQGGGGGAGSADSDVIPGKRSRIS